MGISAAYAPTSGVTPVPIRLWFTAPELDHPLIDDNHDRPLHPLVGLFLRGYLSRYDDMDDDDDEMGHLYTSLCNTKGFACTMLEDLEIEPAVEKNDTGKTILNHQLRWNRERLSNLHTARDSNKVQEVEPESEDLQGMIRQPPKVGAIRFHHEPESINTSHLGVTATAFQGTTSVITSRGPYQLEGARWHLLTKIFSNPESFGADLHSELLLQEHLDENPKPGIDPYHGRFFAKPPNSSEMERKPTSATRVSRPLSFSSMHAEERRSRGGYSTTVQSL